MKKILVVLCCLAFTLPVAARIPAKIPSRFDVVVSFGSMAGGTSSDSFLKSFTKNFSTKHAVKITAYKAAGCGREGEFNVLFCVAKLKTAIKKKFISELNTAVLSQEKKNKAIDENSGNITVEYNKTKSDFSYCREGIDLWK